MIIDKNLNVLPCIKQNIVKDQVYVKEMNMYLTVFIYILQSATNYLKKVKICVIAQLLVNLHDVFGKKIV